MAANETLNLTDESMAFIADTEQLIAQLLGGPNVDRDFLLATLRRLEEHAEAAYRAIEKAKQSRKSTTRTKTDSYD
jgi:hypothetical protein